MTKNRSSSIASVTPSASDLLPPAPSGISVRSPALMNACDLNFRHFFESEGNTVIRLRPEIIALFPEMLPILEWVAQSVKMVLAKEHGLSAGVFDGVSLEVDEKSHPGQVPAPISIDYAVRILNETISVAVASVILKSRYADKPHLLALFGDRKIPDDDQMRSIARLAITEALRMCLVKSQRALANKCNVNSGQLSGFISAGGPLGMRNIIECLDYLAARAEEVSRLEELRKMVFEA